MYTINIERGEKNYIQIQVPQIPADSTSQYVVIQNATAKDVNGNIVAQGHYNTGPYVGDNYNSGTKVSYVINLESYPEIGAITYNEAIYNYEGSPLLNLSSSVSKH